MSIHILPKSKTGRLSSYSFLTAILSFCIFSLLIASGERGGEQFFDNLKLTSPFLISVFAFVLSAILGIYSIIRNRDNSIILYLVTLIGILVGLFAAMELLFPH